MAEEEEEEEEKEEKEEEEEEDGSTKVVSTRAVFLFLLCKHSITENFQKQNLLEVPLSSFRISFTWGIYILKGVKEVINKPSPHTPILPPIHPMLTTQPTQSFTHTPSPTPYPKRRALGSKESWTLAHTKNHGQKRLLLLLL